ncbi:MAG: adenylate/guanylate cyclase domain-containing protein [Aeromicrobium sp.]
MNPRTRRLQARVLRHAGQEISALRPRIQILLTLLLVVTNLIGAVVVAALNLLIVPGGGPSADLVRALAIAIPVYVLAAVVIGAVSITHITLRELDWALSDRSPTRQQRVSALKLPWRITVMQSALWAIAVVLFTTLTLAVQPGGALPTFFSVSIAGIVVSAIAYLFTEWVLRPVAAQALADERDPDFHTAGVRRRMVVFWSLGTAAPVLGLVVAGLVALTRPEEVELARFAWAILSLAAVLLVFGLIVTLLNAQAVVTPLSTLRDALAAVRDGDFETRIVVNDATELGRLQVGFNDMAEGLSERERIRDLFGRHVGASVAAAATDKDVELGGETRVVSVLMIDLIGSTTFATNLPPAEVVEMLNRFFGIVVDEVDRHDGLVNKFMGDAVLAIFGSPVALDDHAAAALGAARGIIGRLATEVAEIGAGIGVSTGEVVAGNVGSQSRFEFTVIGDAVNAAARLTELAKEAPGHVLVSRRSVSEASADEQQHWIDHGSETLRGRSAHTELSVLRC